MNSPTRPTNPLYKKICLSGEFWKRSVTQNSRPAIRPGLTLNLPDSRPNRRHFQEVPANAVKQVRFFLRLQKSGKRQVGGGSISYGTHAPVS